MILGQYISYRTYSGNRINYNQILIHTVLLLAGTKRNVKKIQTSPGRAGFSVFLGQKQQARNLKQMIEQIPSLICTDNIHNTKKVKVL